MIRRAGPADAAALHELAAATFPLACPPGSTAEDQRRFIDDNLSEASFTSSLSDPGRVLFVDVDPAGRLVGYTMLVAAPPTDADVRAALGLNAPTPDWSVSELSKCYALPGAHGTGIAAGLLRATAEEAITHGATRMWLGVNQENARAQRFYAKQGFVRIGTKRFQVGDRLEHDYVLALDLALTSVHSPE